MDISLAIFVFFALSAIASAVMVVTGRNLFHSTMFLGLFLLVVSGYYFLLGSEIVGMMQVFVYVGGVIVVLLFGIMLTAQISNVRLVSATEQRGFTMLSVAALVGLLMAVVLRTTFPVVTGAEPKNAAELVGRMFMTDYILPFEVISILLLAALIGAVIIARQEGKA